MQLPVAACSVCGYGRLSSAFVHRDKNAAQHLFAAASVTLLVKFTPRGTGALTVDTVISYFGSAAWPTRAHAAAVVVGEVAGERKDTFSPDEKKSCLPSTSYVSSPAHVLHGGCDDYLRRSRRGWRSVCLSVRPFAHGPLSRFVWRTGRRDVWKHWNARVVVGRNAGSYPR